MLSKARIHPLSRTRLRVMESLDQKVWRLRFWSCWRWWRCDWRLVTPDRARWPETIVLSLPTYVSIWHIPAKCKASTDNEQYIPSQAAENLTVITSSCSRGMASRDQKAASTEYVYRYPDAHQTSALLTWSLSYLYMPRTLLYIFPRCDTSQFISPTTGRLSYQQH